MVLIVSGPTCVGAVRSTVVEVVGAGDVGLLVASVSEPRADAQPATITRVAANAANRRTCSTSVDLALVAAAFARQGLGDKDHGTRAPGLKPRTFRWAMADSNPGHRSVWTHSGAVLSRRVLRSGSYSADVEIADA